LRACTTNLLVPEEELEERRRKLEASGGYKSPPSQTPWQDIQRAIVDQLGDGMVLKPAVKFHRIAETFGTPRDNH
jgi:dihydroxy-acid dehydratase